MAKPPAYKWQPSKAAVIEVSRLAKESSARAMRTLVDIMSDAEADPRVRVQAASLVLDRGVGKVPNVNHNTSDRTPREYSDAELMAIIEGRELDETTAESDAPLH
jgi:hypothetical protein